MQRESVGGYPGVCQVHRAELKMLHGSFPEAEQEAQVACEQLERFQLFFDAGWGRYQLGEVRRRMGDLDAAAEAFDQAYAFGHDAQPGLALLQLARGELDEANRSIARGLAARAGPDSPPDRPGRAELLSGPGRGRPGARRRCRRARAASEELAEVAAEFSSPVFEASATTARERSSWHAGNPSEAAQALAKAWRQWQEADLPYESARARVLLARRCAAEGDRGSRGSRPSGGARGFRQVGCDARSQRVEELLGTGGCRSPRERVGVAKRTLHVHRHRRPPPTSSSSLATTHGTSCSNGMTANCALPSRSITAKRCSTTGDGFFAALRRRCRRHGLGGRHSAAAREAPSGAWLRPVGPHRPPRSDGDSERRRLSGAGSTSRLASAAAAQREEILVSAAVLEETGARSVSPVSEPRSLELKGVATPVDVRSVDWR